MDVESDRLRVYTMEWMPWLSGPYELYINLTVDGDLKNSYRLTSTALDPLFYDDFSSGLDSWYSFTGSGDSTWSVHEGMGPTVSSDEVAYFGEYDENDDPSGFSGESFSGLESQPIDLINFESAHLYIMHSYGFMGDQGSSGGVVQGRTGDDEWFTLEPDLPHTRILDQDNSGPLEGEYAFQGDRTWYQIGFDLDGLTGSISSIRFAVSSGPEGTGRGWMIDDVMITGGGYDPYDEDPPEPIMGINVVVVDYGWVEIEWTPSFASDIDHYNVYIDEGSTSSPDASNLFGRIEKGEDTVVSLTDLDPEKVYWVAVTGVDRNGNEDRSVNILPFTAVPEGGNHPPVARGRIVGTSQGSIGDDFRFNASSSYDIDGDTLEYLWIFPDGSTAEGKEAFWKSTISGDELTVELVVTDPYGSSGQFNLTLSIEEKDGGNIETDDINRFLVCIVPLSLIIVVPIIIIAFIRGSRNRKLRRRLMDLGKDSGSSYSEEVEVEIREPSVARDRRKVADLVPVLTAKTKRREPGQTVSEDDPKTKDKPEAGKGRTAERLKPDGIASDPTEVEIVTALIECPFCGGTFKKELDRAKVRRGDSLDIRCPNCGRSGAT
jgi:hypothetical protein